MIQLKVKGRPSNITETIIAKVIGHDRGNELLCYSNKLNENILLTTEKLESLEFKVVSEIPELSHLKRDDIVAIFPSGIVYTIFRIDSRNNSLFITDRCNSNCLMCSQPPKNSDDLDFYFDINSQLIKMIPNSTKELGITGGEPTLLGERFVSLLNMIKESLPETEIHVLTNGRSFAWKNIPVKLSETKNQRILYGIPLYSDMYVQHDYIVQAKGAFNQTVIGLHNMAKYSLRLEIRVVLHKQTYQRLPHLAKFIYKNLPFVEHIAFMALEFTGYTPKNSSLLWVEPSEYQTELEDASLYLHQMGMNVSIYNLQLCLLKPTLWQFARKSISDWKREYLPECSKCQLLQECGGVFATSKKHSSEIKAILV